MTCQLNWVISPTDSINRVTSSSASAQQMKSLNKKLTVAWVEYVQALFSLNKFSYIVIKKTSQT